MNKFVKIFLVAIAVLTLAGIGVVVAEANTNRVITTDQTVNDDVFAGGETISIDGTVNGDVYAAGQQVSIHGTVNGDVYAAAKTIEVSGNVQGSVHVAGQNVKFSNAKVGNSVQAAGSEVKLNNSNIGGSLLAAGNTIDESAKVGRNFLVGGNIVGINGQISGYVKAATTQLTFGPNAVIGGQVEYHSNNMANITNGAQLNGGVRQIQTQTSKPQVALSLAKLSHALLIWSYLGALIVGLVIVAFLKRPLAAVSVVLREKFAASFGWGALLAIASWPVLIIMALTVVGIPLSLLLGTLLATGIYLSKFIVGFTLGSYLLKRINSSEAEPNRYVAMVIGVSLISLARILPLVNFAASILVTFAGLGVLAIAIKHSLSSQPTIAVARSTKKQK